MRYFSLFLSLCFYFTMSAQTSDFVTPHEKDNATSATYSQAIDYYQRLARSYSQLQLREWGMTDAGFPLHTAVLSKDKVFDPVELRRQNKRILLVNNAIHPGEPEGVDATMMLFRDILQKAELQPLLDKVVFVTIPFYNIGGGLNRGCCSRASQNGPEAYGFRGNAKNLDLNRDFIKCDSKNARTFTQIFNYWQPDVFVDNHTSNGADYTYTMTMLATQEDKLGPVLGDYLRNDLLPQLYADMADRDLEMCPYVNVWGDIPDNGIPGFNDSPRYSSGYAAQHHCIAFVPETHMLKPYPSRVHATYQFMEVLLKNMNRDAQKIGKLRQEAVARAMTQKTMPLNYQLDKTQVDSIIFKGYQAKYKPSEISGLDRLWYDRSAPYARTIPYMNHFKPALEVEKPVAYIIPQAYSEVIELLKMNGVKFQRLSEDATIEPEMYYIKKYETQSAYESHYLHYNIEVEKVVRPWDFHKGDFVAYTDQPAVRFLMETLEPQNLDSYFAWNFFDGILGQKEWFSSYVFEDMAATFLKENPVVREELESRKKADPKFAEQGMAQLAFVYQRSPYFEQTLNLYPVGRVMGETKLPVSSDD